MNERSRCSFPLLLLGSLLVACAEDPGGIASGAPGGGPAPRGPGDFALTLHWDPPTSNIDGSPVADLAGYRVYDGFASRHYDMVSDVGNVTEATIAFDEPGTYFLSMTAYDVDGNESPYSNEVVVAVPLE